MAFTYVTIVGTYETAVDLPARGVVEFTPIDQMHNGLTVISATVPATLDAAGSISARLAATTDPATKPVGVTYRVDERITGQPVRTYYVSVPHDQGTTLQLANLTAFESTGAGGFALRGAVDYDDSVSPADGQVMTWDSTTTKYHPENTAAGAVSSVNGATGAVSITASGLGAQPIDSDLTAIAALTPLDGSYLGRQTGAWTARTPTQVKTDLVINQTQVDARDYKVGGVVTAASINAALDAADNPGAFGEVVLPGGLTQLEALVTLRQGVILTGAGPHDAASQPGTELRPASGYTGAALKFPVNGSNVWHYGGVRRMRVKNFTSHGIWIEGGMGEAAVIDQVMVTANGGDGIRIEGPSTPSMIGRVSVHANTGAGIRLVAQNQTHTQIEYIAGDNNGESLMTIDALDPTSSVRVGGWKAERWANGAPGHPSVFVINDGNGGYVDLGVGRVQIGTGVTAPTGAIVKQTAGVSSSVGRVDWVATVGGAGATTTPYAYGYQDTKNSKTLTVASATRRRVWGVSPVLNALSGLSAFAGIAESCPRTALVAVTTPVAGTAYGMRITLGDGNYSQLTFTMQNTPAGLSGTYFGLYDADTLAQFSVSSDLSSSLNGATGLRTVTLNSTGVAAKDYYVVFLAASGTTFPVFYGAQIGSSAIAALDPPVCHKHQTTGLTTLPSTFVLASAAAGLVAPWYRYV